MNDGILWAEPCQLFAPMLLIYYTDMWAVLSTLSHSGEGGKLTLFKDSFSFHRSISINEYFNCQMGNYISKDFRLGHIVQLPGMQMSRKTLMVTLGGRLTSPLQGTQGQEEESTQSNMSWTHCLRLDMPFVSWTPLSSLSPRPLSPYKPPTALPLPVTPNPTPHQPPSTGPKLPQ